MDNDLICNFKKCRQRLDTFAWVTSCSHIFCDDDGGREFKKSNTCPACNTSLIGKFDIVRVDLQPSEQYKSMAITGLKPENIMDICSRAMAFWSYQCHQEHIYLQYSGTRAKEKVVQLEQYYEEIIARTSSEINTLKTQLAARKQELESFIEKYNEISDKMLDKTRQYQRLQTMYDTLRRRCVPLPTNMMEATQLPPTPSLTKRASRSYRQYDIPITTGAEYLSRLDAGDVRNKALQAEREFLVQESNLPSDGHYVLVPRPAATPMAAPPAFVQSSVQDAADSFNIPISNPRPLTSKAIFK